MKLDVVIGNPPYQAYQGMSSKGNKNFSKPIYPEFMEASYKIGDRVTLVTPGRFLFNAGATKKAWNRKMLDDRHLKVIDFEMDSSKVFDNTDIKGGVAITYRDNNKDGDAIKLFIPHIELSYILEKVEKHSDFMSFMNITYNSSSYTLSEELIKSYTDNKDIQKRGAGFALETNILDKLNIVFHDDKPQDDENYVQVYGRTKSKGRVYKWVRNDYIDTPKNFEKWKVFLPKSNGSGALGEVLSTPLVGQPFVGHTRTFMSFGSFENEDEATSCLKYIKTKFSRVMLGILKVTQDNHPRTWEYVPLQDFTHNSDIDWSKSIPEIDQQLYKKYGLNEEEIEFIETHVSGMV